MFGERFCVQFTTIDGQDRKPGLSHCVAAVAGMVGESVTAPCPDRAAKKRVESSRATTSKSTGMKILLFGVVLAASAVGLGEARAEPAAGPVIE